MRTDFCDAMVARASDPSVLFLTGDLGFMALEPLEAALGDRFVNAGVAEQNMVSVAAGLARAGFEPWVYSIAPFCYARPFEQIRNDIALHDLPVKLVGNGGGYGYGVMGPTHHAIEDYGVLLTLPNLRVFVPAFDQDVGAVVQRAGDAPQAAYVRLGRGEAPAGWSVPAYAPWRLLVEGDGPVVIAVGPLAGHYVEACLAMDSAVRPCLWAACELPLSIDTMPGELVTRLASGRPVCVAEEHVAHGGLGSALALECARHGIALRSLQHLHALAHRYERYGSQAWLRRRSRLDADALRDAVAELTGNLAA